MIEVKELVRSFEKNKLSFFTGVPDSTFKGFMSYLNAGKGDFIHRKAPNEGAAVAQATGYFLSTGVPGVVYMQNSGLGNAINPLTSLADEEVYGIPMLLLIGWRGEPGNKDEPQHKKMGACMLSILDSIGVSYRLIDIENYEEQINWARAMALEESKPVALIVRTKLIGEYKDGPILLKKIDSFPLREKIIEGILSKTSKDTRIFSTTGKTSRELFEVSEVKGREHCLNFYNVGAMGFVSSIALEFARNNTGETMILDGDGALIMQMGSLSAIGASQLSNIVHVVIDNGVHESTGSQPTLSKGIHWEGLFKANGYKRVKIVEDLEDFQSIDLFEKEGPTAIVFYSSPGSRNDLGRPTITPNENKISFMENLKK